jgi:hypothetical protein
LLLYALVVTVLVVTLRAMSRRWRAEGDSIDDVPYGPSGGFPAEVSA